MKQLVKKNILGVGVTNATTEEILEYIHKSIRKKAKPYYVVTPNPEMVVASVKNTKLRHSINNAEIASADGLGLGVAGVFLGQSLKGRTTGVGLVEKLCEKVADYPITVGFLGARLKVAEQAAECLKSRFPNLKVVFISSEWENNSSILGEKYCVTSSMYYENKKIHDTKYMIQNTDAIDILFVAFGVPKQEFWMAEHVGKIPVRVMIGVGGAFDYISGKVVRAPKIIQVLGFEWLFRLVVQPWRWKRQLALIAFMWLVGKNVISKPKEGKN